MGMIKSAASSAAMLLINYTAKAVSGRQASATRATRRRHVPTVEYGLLMHYVYVGQCTLSGAGPHCRRTNVIAHYIDRQQIR